MFLRKMNPFVPSGTFSFGLKNILNKKKFKKNLTPFYHIVCFE
jgi:hypothetical protein